MSLSYLLVFFCISFLHIFEAIAQPLYSCVKKCLHLFDLATRHVLFPQHDFLVRGFSFQHPDLDRVGLCTDTRSAKVFPNANCRHTTPKHFFVQNRRLSAVCNNSCATSLRPWLGCLDSAHPFCQIFDGRIPLAKLSQKITAEGEVLGSSCVIGWVSVTSGDRHKK